MLLATLDSLVEATQFQAGQQRGAVMVIRCVISCVGGCSSVLLDALVATTADTDSGLTSYQP